MNVLAIGAHFDDIELGCAGSLAKHKKKGDNIYMFVGTKSGYANNEGINIRSNEEAVNEGIKSAELLGAELICGNIESYNLEYDESINSILIKIIENKKIDLIYTHWTGDALHDHSNIAHATMHTSRHVPRVLMYRSNWYITDATFKKNYFVDITDTWNIKKEAISMFSSELKRVQNSWLDYFEREALNNGLIAGVKYAEAFELVKWLD